MQNGQFRKNRQHRNHKTKTNNATTKYKTNNTECVLYHYAQANMSVKSSTELMLYVVLTMPTLNKAYLLLFIIIYNTNYVKQTGAFLQTTGSKDELS
jgi:hypothetical protein